MLKTNQPWASMVPAHQDLDRALEALRKHAWDEYVEPSSSEGKYVKTAEKQASIFISEEDHAKLRGIEYRK